MLSCSDGFKQEYCCTVVRIGECFPIEGADRIQKTLVNGQDMVISKEIKPGDIMIYAGNETQLNSEFISLNNQFGIGDCELNANAGEVQKLLVAGENDKAKALCGFFNKHCRVKMLKLKGVYSFGFLFTPEFFIKWRPALKSLDFNALVGTDFDTVNGELFVKAYIPEVKTPRNSGKGPQPNLKEKRVDTLIEGNFFFHYDSIQLQRNIHKICPIDNVAITVKLHGTSAIYARTKCRIPKQLSWLKKAVNKLAGVFGKKPFTDYFLGQDVLYSSRSVLKNRYRNANVSTTTNDVWGFVNNKISPFLEDNTTVYGEIIGYMPGDKSKFIQKNYDYGCKPGECMFMPYRVVKNGKELDVTNVIEWTKDFMDKHPEVEDFIYVMPLLYHGKLTDLYPDIPVDNDWHENILAAMKADRRLLGMEGNEGLCNNKVPREGVCIRIDGDPVLENFKLKCAKFLSKESAAVDAGEIDMESLEAQM